MKKKTKGNFEYYLESLRGFAALFVVLHHVAGRYNTWLDPNYKPEHIEVFETPGHLSVLIFFVLSGYVIGVSHKERLTSSNVLLYLKKRFVRLYPIYIAGIIITMIAAQTVFHLGTVVGHIIFMQVLAFPVFYQNSVLWSLHYEFLFYLLFIPISFFRINPIFVICVCIIMGMTNSFLYPAFQAPIITSYMYGFCFWISGLEISRRFTVREFKTNFSLLLSSIFLILSLRGGVYNVLIRGLDKLNFLLHNKLIFPESVDWHKQAISFYDFSSYPYCLMFILLFTEKKFKYKMIAFGFLQLLPLYAVFHIIKSNLNFQDYFLPTVYYIISVFLYFVNSKIPESVAEKVILFGSRIGGLSYSLYIIHMPILYFYSRINLFSGSVITYFFRFISYIIITLMISIALEDKLQQRIKKYFFPSHNQIKAL